MGDQDRDPEQLEAIAKAMFGTNVGMRVTPYLLA